MKQRVTESGIVILDRMLDDHMAIMLSFDDFERIRNNPKASAYFIGKIQKVLPKQCFLMANEDDKINGFTLIEYIYRIQLSLSATRFLSGQLNSTNGELLEQEYAAIIHRTIANPAKRHLQIDTDFLEYYQLICTRMLLLPHDTKKRQGVLLADDLLECENFHDFFRLMDMELCEHFDMESNRFSPATIRNIHRQYMQLDKDKNGMISASEMEEYGKKKAFNPIHQQPTHDLTPAFIAQVFSECPTYPPDGEMDCKAYIDFTLLMADKASPISLRFFWNCLDFQKQGFLDKFTIDYFLRDLVEKIRLHDEDDTTPLERLRTQIFDIVPPHNPSRITWKDLQNCKAGHTVVRILTDYVSFRAYEDSGIS
ncbi:hypothetical protein FI667_g7941, partial [Globisporangium splendens]